MSSAPVAFARVTSVCLLSQCMLVPLGCLLRDLQPRMERALGHQRAGRRVQAWTRLALDSFKGPPSQYGEGPPASRSTVGCKLGHDSPWDTFTETSVKGSDAINPHGWEKRSLSETHHFLRLPFLTGFQVTAAKGSYSGHTREVRGAYGDRTQSVRRTRLRLGRFLRRSFSCNFLGGFHRLFEGFLVSSDSRIVRESPPVSRPAQPGWKPSHLGCSRVPACRQACSLGWSPSHLVSGSSSPSQPRQELLCSAAPPGQPFFLDYVVYASCSLSSSGALGRLPWGTQGLFWVTLNKEFSFREEVRSWSRSC